MKQSRFTRVAVGGFIALTMVAAACGSDNKSSETTAAPATTGAATETTGASETSAPAETTPETFAPPTGEPIKIGTTLWTAEMVSLTIKLPGIKAAIEQINAHGGINGRPLEFDYCGATDANTGEACARQMVADGVVATIEDANMLAEANSTKILNDAGIAQIDPFINGADSLNSPNVFMMCPPTPIDYAAVVGYAKEAGLKTVHFLAGEMSQSDNSVNSATTAAQYYGLETTGRTGIPMTAADYLPQMQEAANVNSDVNLAIIAPFMTNLLLQAADQLGVPAKLGLGEGQFNADQLAQYGKSGGALDGSLLVSCVPPYSAADKYPKVKEGLDAINAYYEETKDELAAPNKLTTYAMRSYIAVQAFATMARGLDEVTAESVLAALQSPDTSIDLGLDHPWTPATKGPEGYASVSNTWEYLCTVKDGKSVLFQDEPIDAALPFK